MASTSRLTYTALHPVSINWGDGTTDSWPASPPPGGNIATHSYASPGPWSITLTDTVTGQADSAQAQCPTCSISGAVLRTTDATSGAWTIGPLVNNIDGADLLVDWGDGTVDTVASGGTGAHTYVTSGSFTVLVTSSANATCTATPTGGNGPTGDTIVLCERLTATATVVGPPENGEWEIGPFVGATGPVEIDWGDAGFDIVNPGDVVAHEYPPAAGSGPFSITATDTATGCPITITGTNGNDPGQVYVPATAQAAVTAGTNEVCVTLSNARSSLYYVSWLDDANPGDTALTPTGPAPWTATACHTYPGGGGSYTIVVSDRYTPYVVNLTGTAPATWASMKTGYTDWNALMAANATWTDALNG